MQLRPQEEWNRLESDCYREQPEKLLADISKRNRISYLNILPVFLARQKQEGSNPYFYIEGGPGHFSETGHEWISTALGDYILLNCIGELR